MKSLVFVLLLAFALCSCKEDLEQLEQLLKNPEIIDLVKRLGLLEDESSDLSSDGITNEVSTDAKPSDSDDRSCSKKNESSTIIQTKISLNNGAVFLGSQHGVSDVKHCAQMCCETDDCDVSVYQDKDKRACYLFNCKDDKTEVNRCEFSTHKDYYSIFVTKVRADASKGQDTPEENDLSDLHLHIPDKQNPTTTTVKPTTVFYHPHSVGNGGACVEDLNCEDIHAECRARTCQCRSGFYEKRGQCRKVCGSSEFECVEPGTAVTGPDCIPKSQFCDGQTQCGDGSDEINCPTTGPPRWNWPPAPTPYQSHGSNAKTMASSRPPQSGHSDSSLPLKSPQYNSLAGISRQPVGYHEGKLETEDSSAFDLESMSKTQKTNGNTGFPHKVASAELPVMSSSQAAPEKNGKNALPGGQGDKHVPDSVDDASSHKQQANSDMSETDAEIDEPEIFNHRLELELKTGLEPSGNLGRGGSREGVPSPHDNSNAVKTSSKAASSSPPAETDPDSKDSVKPKPEPAEAPHGVHQVGNEQFAEGKVFVPSKPVQASDGSSSGNSQVPTRAGHPDSKKHATMSHATSHADDSGSPDQYTSFKSPTPISHAQSNFPPKGIAGDSYPMQTGTQGSYGLNSQARKGFLSSGEDSGRYLPKPQSGHAFVPKYQNGNGYLPGTVSGNDRFLPGSQSGMGYARQPGQLGAQGSGPLSKDQVRLGGYDFYPSQQTPFRPSRPVQPPQSGPSYQLPYNGQYPSFQRPNYNKYLGLNYDYTDYDPYFGDQDYQTPSQRKKPVGADRFHYPSMPRGHSSSNAVDSHKETPKVPQGNNKENSDSSPTNTGSGKTHPTVQDGGPAAGSDENLKPQTAAPQKDKGKGGKAPDAVPASGVDKVKLTSSNVSSTAGVDKHPSPNGSKGSDGDKGRNGKGGSEQSLGKPKGSAGVDSNAVTPSHAGSGLEGIQSESAVFVERVAPTDLYSTKGPIIALSLGLCFTVILLIFAGCRLRTIRRRLRKGRPLHSNEADYLINGMYL